MYLHNLLFTPEFPYCSKLLLLEVIKFLVYGVSRQIYCNPFFEYFNLKYYTCKKIIIVVSGSINEITY